MRAETLALVPPILGHLLEDNDEDDFDMKDLAELGTEDMWIQIDGDFGDPWEYGGDWYNSVTNEVIHWDGMEMETEGPDAPTDPDDVEVPASMTAALDRRFPLDYMDPDGDEEWTRRVRDDNERERERLIGQYQYARAAYLDARKPHTVFIIDINPDGVLDHWLQGRVEDAARTMGMPVADFTAMPLASQMVEFGRYLGYSDLGYSERMSKIELARQLNTTL
jgi:hypothetical protein